MFLAIAAFLVGACWGSFLNVVACRLLISASLTGRSRCPQCRTSISWFDLIPVVSFCVLGGRCRSCHARISWLYPCIELVTALVFVLIALRAPMHFWPAYLLFFSALIVTVRTDIESYAVLRMCSLYLAPVGCLLAAVHLLPIPLISSFLGAGLGYGFLWLVAQAYRAATGVTGMGDGDMELLACIGAFLGVRSLVPTVLVASLTATALSLVLMACGRANRHTRIPFGPFLAVGALVVFVLFYWSY